MAVSKVAVVRCESYDENLVYEAVKKGIDLIGGFDQIFKKGEKILLKPNTLMGSKPEKAVSTHPSVFFGVIKYLKENGITLTYGDSPGAGKPADVLTKCELTPVAERFQIPLGDFEKSRSVDYPEGLIGKRFEIANACFDIDGIVSLPKMKTHALTRITGAIKNQFGCVTGLNKPVFHVKVPNQVNFSKMLVDLNHILKLRLFIMDGIVAMEGNGPGGGTPVSMNCLIISTDPVAVDSTFCRMIEMDPEFVPTITFGSKTGLGNYKAEAIQLVGDPIEGFIKPSFDVVRKPLLNVPGRKILPAFISNALFPRPVINPSLCVKCGACVEACPVEGKAVNFKNGNKKAAPVYNYNKCIRCYCCQEMCPYKAITVKKPVLARLLTGA